MATTFAFSLCTSAAATSLGSKRASCRRSSLAAAPAPARVTRRNVTTRAVKEVMQANFKAEVLEVRET